DNAPAAAADSYVLSQAALDVGGAQGVLANDSDPDGDALTATLVAGPAHGALAFRSDGSFVYTPDDGFVGTDTPTYQATDGGLESLVTAVTLAVGHVNQAPVAQDDAYTVKEGSPLTVAGPGVLGNDSDPDGDALAAVLLSAPANGTASLEPDGTLDYTPDDGF